MGVGRRGIRSVVRSTCGGRTWHTPAPQPLTRLLVVRNRSAPILLSPTLVAPSNCSLLSKEPARHSLSHWLRRKGRGFLGDPAAHSPFQLHNPLHVVSLLVFVCLNMPPPMEGAVLFRVFGVVLFFFDVQVGSMHKWIRWLLPTVCLNLAARPAGAVVRSHNHFDPTESIKPVNIFK